jgi:enoyl-CoA hydratase/carnithine racemase
MGDWQYIRTEVEDKIAVLTIDHPPVNSFNKQVVTELEGAIDELLADDDVKAIVITGGGTNAFVAGADIPEIKALLDQPEEGYAASREFIERGQGVNLKIEKARDQSGDHPWLGWHAAAGPPRRQGEGG